MKQPQLYNKIINNIAKGVKNTLNEDNYKFDVNQYSDDDILDQNDIDDAIKIKPKTNEEFYRLVAQRVKQNPQDPYLLDIDTSNVTDMSDLFWYNENKDDYKKSQMLPYYKRYRTQPDLVRLDISAWNTSNVVNMSYMFYGCAALQKLNLSNFDTSNVTSMQDMFYNCRSLSKLNISNFNTHNVRNMSGMFAHCWSLQKLNLSHFKVPCLESMSWLVYDCKSLTYLNLYNWNLVGCINIHEMIKETNIKTLRLSKSIILKLIDYKQNVDIKIL